MNIHKLWAAMGSHEFGPEPIVIEIEDGEINVFTLSCKNENGQDGLFVSGRGKTLKEAVEAFEKDLDDQLAQRHVRGDWRWR